MPQGGLGVGYGVSAAWESFGCDGASAGGTTGARRTASAGGMAMSATTVARATARQQTVDVTGAPLAILSTAAEVLFVVGRSVFGPERVPTARSNAWRAVCADRERARARAEAQRVLSRVP